MLPKKIIQKPHNSHSSINYGKYGQKKQQKIRQQSQNQDKQNQQQIGNSMMPTVDMTKKIRKRSPQKWVKNGQKAKVQKLNGIPVYREQELGFDSQLTHMIQHQRIDNDIDTDEQQIQSGVQRLANYLKEACIQRMYMDSEVLYGIQME